jgi:hypothetical protein
MLASLIFLAGLQTAPAAAPPLPPQCEGEAFSAFDFWVGEWDVYATGSKTLVAHSRIEKLYGGCAIRESWMPLRGSGGGSLSAYDPKSGRWQQSWVGGGPGTVLFDGGGANGAMVLTGWWPGSGPKGEDGLTRMTYSPLDDGGVRQHGEFSADQGLTWTTTFDFTYHPKEAPQ